MNDDNSGLDLLPLLRVAAGRVKGLRVASDEIPEQLLFGAAHDAIEQLKAALALAVGELSTHGEYTAWNPEQLMNQFLEEARNA